MNMQLFECKIIITTRKLYADIIYNHTLVSYVESKIEIL